MKKLLFIFILSLGSIALFSQTKTFKVGTTTPADTTQQLIYNVNGSGITKIGLVTGSDTAWMRWDGSVLNFISDTLKHNGELIGGTSTGLKTIIENGDTGWVFTDSDRTDKLDIGQFATDMSFVDIDLWGDTPDDPQPLYGASGHAAVAIGIWNIASGPYSFTGGFANRSSHEQSFTHGSNNWAKSINDFAIGQKNVVDGPVSFAAATRNSTVTGTNSAAIGGTNQTITQDNMVGIPALQFKPITAPSSPVNGTLYYSSADSTFYKYNGVEWDALGSGGGAGSTLWTSSNDDVAFPSTATSIVPIDAGAVLMNAPYMRDGIILNPANPPTNEIAWSASSKRFMAWGKINQLHLSAYAGNTSDINTALAANTDIKTVIVDTSFTMTANWTLPSDITLKFERGSIINTDAYTLTGDYTTIDAGMYQIFTLTSNVEGLWTANNGEAFVEWFGAKGDGTTNDSPAMQAFVDFISTNNLTGYLVNAKTYLITAPIIIASPVILDGDGSCTIIPPPTTAATTFSLRNDFSISNVKFDITNAYASGGVILLDQDNATEGTNVVVDGCSMVGGNLSNTYLFSTGALVDAFTAGAITLKNNDFDNCRRGVRVECLTHGAIQVLNNSFHDYIEDATATNEAYCINLGQAGGTPSGHENALKVSNILVDGNKAWNYQMNNAGLGNGTMFVRAYASNIVISNNQLSNGGAGVDMTASSNYLTCFYLSGDNMLVTGNIVKDFGFGRGRFCLFKNAITLASTVSKHQRVVNNNIVYRIKDPNTAYGSIMLADIASYVAENYIVDDYVDDSDDSYAISMGHTQSTIDNQGEHGYFRNNFILTNRNALRLGGNLGFSDIVEENIFISTNTPITANRYMITDDGRSTATAYRNNTFTCTNGSMPFYQDYVNPNRENTEFTGNTFRVSNPDAATTRDMRVFANQKQVGTILINDNNFILENIFTIGQFGNSDVIFSNNKYRAAFNLPNVTGTKFLILAQGDGSGESNFTMENNDIRIADTSTLGGTIYGVQLLAGQTFNNVTIAENIIKGGTNLAKFTYGIYKTTINKFLIKDNEWTNWGRCIYGYYSITDLTIERDKATNTTDYLYLNGGATNAMLSGLNITATSNALDLRATIENLSIDRCIFNATTADISLNASGVITNLYGLNSGENYTFANSGTITNVYGVNQVETGVTVTNNLKDLNATTFTSDNITDDGTDVEVSAPATFFSGRYDAVSDLLTSSTTIDSDYTYWLFNPSTAITATLPSVTSNKGLVVVIYNYSSTSSMTIALNGTDKIDGTAGSVTLGTNDKIRYVSSGNATIGWIEESERTKP